MYCNVAHSREIAGTHPDARELVQSPRDLCVVYNIKSMRGIADHHNGMDYNIITSERRVHDKVVLWYSQAIYMAYPVLLMDRIRRIMSDMLSIWIRKHMVVAGSAIHLYEPHVMS